ncbi:hypothetical protein JTE90_022764 [Oedothorax gibbosus]|uniref:Kazal-like domain-containing protein n=1 Tax=Oedothorax gibbosus TaxID=931172 RepID=A0AAV6U8W2_9ARAC|nr:hypothetical protein JTE90_022764 [Oedothorax gibbosus]
MKKKIYLNSSLPKESKGDDCNREDLDTNCGFGHFTPKWLHSWATPRMYLVLLSIAGVASEIFHAYQVGVMSTLEKRFAFESKIAGTIMAVNEATALLFGVLVGYYGAITFLLRYFGPLLGYLMSSMCLNYYENPLEDPGYGPNDPRWVGAWWIGFLLEGFLFLLVTIPIIMFPRNLPGFKMPVDNPGTDTRTKFSGMFKSVKRILFNQLWWAVMLNIVFVNYWAVGHRVMLPKYMEHQFRLTTSDASLYSGVPRVGAIIVAITLSGYFIWRFRPSLKFLIGMKILTEIIGACGYMVLMIPKCEKFDMANFGMNNEGLILDGNCNMNCNCSRKAFTPVCGSDRKTLYFSPCYAGCDQSLNKTFFSNCSCISESSDLTFNYATEGFCISESCWLQALAYIITWPTMQFIVSLSLILQKLMLIRCIQPQDKSIALGISETVMSLLGYVPNLIIFGVLVDSACLVWQSSCGETGSCWFYDTDKFSKIIHGVSAGFSFVALIPTCLIFLMRERFCDFYEDDLTSQTRSLSHPRSTSFSW